MQSPHPLKDDIYEVDTIDITNPGAGNMFTYTVPAHERIEVISIKFTIITDATVVNRAVEVNLSSPAAEFCRVNVKVNIPASKTYTCYFASNYTHRDDTAIFNSLYNPIPHSLIIKAGDIIASAITNFQAGDQILLAKFRVKRWLTE